MRVYNVHNAVGGLILAVCFHVHLDSLEMSGGVKTGGRDRERRDNEK